MRIMRSWPDGLLKEPAGVGDQWGVLERQQRLGRRRRRGGVAKHRGGVLGPHLPVFGLVDRDRRRVLPQEVGRYQNHQFSTVLGDHRRGHRQPIRRLVGRRSNPDLGGGQLGLPRGDAHPRHIRRGRRHHQTRRRTYPRPHRQTPDHRLKRRRGRKQVTRHAMERLSANRTIPAGRGARGNVELPRGLRHDKEVHRRRMRHQLAGAESHYYASVRGVAKVAGARRRTRNLAQSVRPVARHPRIPGH